jgi:hypothetical protein
MGGYGSGRTKTHHITGECIPIDTSRLLKQKLLADEKREQGQTWTFTTTAKYLQREAYSVRHKEVEKQTQHSIHVLVERYDQGGTFARWDAIGHVTIGYTYSVEDENKGKQVVDLPLVVTHPNYGGVRYWFLAPCCGERVRIVYLPTFGETLSLPSCRKCIALNYASQQSSYIDHHIAREKHLLINYGWTWAEFEYDMMKEHYFEITPEYREKKLRSQYMVQMHFIKRLISHNRFMLKHHTQIFRTIRSTEDRCTYLEHLLGEWGTRHVLMVLEHSRGHPYAPMEEIEGLTYIIGNQPKKEGKDPMMDDQKLIQFKQQIENDLEWLDKAA